MAAKNLNPEEMVHTSAAWLDPENDGHKTIVLVPILAASLPLVEEAHRGMLPLVKAPPNDRLAEIIALEAELDLRHDAIIRGSFGILTSAAELAGGDEGAQLITLRDTLIPEGPQSMLKSYRAESTQAVQLEQVLSPEVRARTDAILIGAAPNAKTLTAYLEEWIALGKRLGALEDEKGRIEAAMGEAVAGGASLKARNFWVRVVNAMVANAELIDLDPAKKATIFGPLWNAERKADERAAARQRAKAATESAEEKGAAATEEKGAAATEAKSAEAKSAEMKAAEEKGAGEKPAEAKPEQTEGGAG